jgi:hypothetical protein
MAVDLWYTKQKKQFAAKKKVSMIPAFKTKNIFLIKIKIKETDKITHTTAEKSKTMALLSFLLFFLCLLSCEISLSLFYLIFKSFSVAFSLFFNFNLCENVWKREKERRWGWWREERESWEEKESESRGGEDT